MVVWAIADPHLSLSTDKPMDIFGSRWDHHHERLATAWQERIGSDDWVIIPGDISWGMTLAQAKADLAFIHALPGQKILSRGNHDYWWTSIKKMNEFCMDHQLNTLHFMRNNMFQVGESDQHHLLICGTRGWIHPTDNAWQGESDERIFNREVGRLKLSLSEAARVRNQQSTVLVALHYPPFTRLSPQSELVSVMTDESVDVCIYGHVHGLFGSRSPEGLYDGIRYINVASDHLNFEPKAIWSSEAGLLVGDINQDNTSHDIDPLVSVAHP